MKERAKKCLPRSLLNKEFQTGEVAVGCSIVSRKSSTVCLHLCHSSNRKQPLNNLHAPETGCEVEHSGTRSILILKPSTQICIGWSWCRLTELFYVKDSMELWKWLNDKMKVTVVNSLLFQSCSGKCYEGNQVRHLVASMTSRNNKLKHCLCHYSS